MRVSLFFLLFIFLIPSLVAIGVSPPSYVLNYEPGMERDFSHRIINTYGEDMIASVKVEGELIPYITHYNTTVPMSGTSGSLHYSIKLPEDSDMVGRKYAKFHVTEEFTHSGGGTGAKTAVIAILRIDFPYPGKYAELYLYTRDANEGEAIQLPLTMISLGNEVLSDASITLGILDSYGNLIIEETIDGITLQPQQEIELTHTFPSAGLPPGPYVSYGTLAYEDGRSESTRQFIVGTLDMQIIDHTKKLTEGKINPIEIRIKSRWDGILTNVYGVLTINGKDHQSASHQLSSFQEKSLEFFVDTTGIDQPKVQGELTLHFEGKRKLESIEFLVEKEQREEVLMPVLEKPKDLSIPLNMTTILILIVIILIAVNAYILLRKKK